MQQSNKPRAKPSADSGATKANPNPNLQVRKAGPTYRARQASPASAPRDMIGQRTQVRLYTEARRRRIRMAIFLVVGLLAVGGIAAYAFVVIPVGQVLNAGQKIFVTPVGVRPAPGGGPNATPIPVVYPDWDKKEPVNILLLGLDLRPEEEDSRADTQVVVHIDPAEKTAAMFSVPRDLYVDIPGHGEDRINAAFQLGENDTSIQGGGPSLAMATIEHNFGIKIHYFAQVDFTGFERVVDAMGGIVVDVPKPLADNEYPLSDYGATRIYVSAGLQHMDGRTALQYARSRHADDDIGRNARQQQVLMAIRQQGLSLNLLSSLNELLNQLSGAVKTDLSVTQVGSLAQLARQIDRDSIETFVISRDMAIPTITNGGADVLMPNWDLIRPQVQSIFADPRLANEAARISVQNGTNTGGIGGKLGDLLTGEGFFVADLSLAPDQGNHPTTTITDFTGGLKPRSIEKLAGVLNIDPSAVERGSPEDAPISASDNKPVDILVVAGDDRDN